MSECPSVDVLLDQILKDAEVPQAVALHIRTCPTCAREMAALREVCRALAQPEAMPSGWVDRVMFGLSEEPRRVDPLVSLLGAFPTFGLAAATVALAIPILAPGGMRSISGALLYSALVGSAVAAAEIFAVRQESRWRV